MDKEIQHVEARDTLKMGLAGAEEDAHLAQMNVQENLEMGAFTRRDRANVSRDMDWVFECFPRLKERRKQLAGTLSGGEQQMLAMGRAVMSAPKLIMLDERVDGPVADSGDGDFQDHREAQGAGRDGAAG